MAEVNQDATIDQGATVEIEVPCVDEDGAALDLTGKDLFYVVARTAGGARLLVVTRPEITNAVDVATIPLTAAETAALPADDLWHELYMLEDGTVTPLMQGTLTVVASQAAQHT